jgi:hypothetical protein
LLPHDLSRECADQLLAWTASEGEIASINDTKRVSQSSKQDSQVLSGLTHRIEVFRQDSGDFRHRMAGKRPNGFGDCGRDLSDPPYHPVPHEAFGCVPGAARCADPVEHLARRVADGSAEGLGSYAIGLDGTNPFRRVQ